MYLGYILDSSFFYRIQFIVFLSIFALENYRKKFVDEFLKIELY